MEIWKKIKNYETNYEISNFGNVRSITRNVERINPHGDKSFYIYKSKILKSFITNKGYLRLGLYINDIKKNHQIHRLVADAFIDNKYNKEQVNHKNGIKTDNNIDNLEWVDNYENFKHSVKLGLQVNSTKNGSKRKIS